MNPPLVNGGFVSIHLPKAVRTPVVRLNGRTKPYRRFYTTGQAHRSLFAPQLITLFIM
jgi:hypothetical protein